MSDSELSTPQSLVDQTESSSVVEALKLRPGAQLALHRQNCGMTIEQVANQLNLAPRQIQALEIDNYAALPGTVIARGFVRAYAKLLKVDPTPLIAMMPGEIVQMESLELKRALSGSFSESRLPPMTTNSLFSKWVVGTVLLILLVFGVLAAQRFGWVASLPESMSESMEKSAAFFPTSSTKTTALDPQKVEYNVAPRNSLESDAPATTPGNVEARDNHVVMDVVEAPMQVSAHAPVSSHVVDSIATENSKKIVNKNLLVVKVREDSWVEVRGIDDSILISKLILAGSTEMLSINKPVSVTIGNASGVDLIFRENPIDLKAVAKNNIAKLSLK